MILTTAPTNSSVELGRVQIWDNGKPSKPQYSRYACEAEFWLTSDDPHNIRRPAWKKVAALSPKETFIIKAERLHKKGSVTDDCFNLISQVYKTISMDTHVGLFYCKQGGGTNFFDMTFAVAEITRQGVLGGYVFLNGDGIRLPPFVGTANNPKIIGRSCFDRVDWSMTFATGDEG